MATAVSRSTYGSVPTNFIMDDVNCAGTEGTLEDCSYNPIDNCGSSEGAGVICRSTTTPFDITLVGGTSSTLSAETNEPMALTTFAPCFSNVPRTSVEDCNNARKYLSRTSGCLSNKLRYK